MAGPRFSGAGSTAPLPAADLEQTPRDTLAARGLIGVVRLYQHIVSPWIPQSCRFSPSCSCYTRDALSKHGALRGSWLAVRRLVRCHPFSAGGWDPVP
jgi:putative membrane protein insertion efficiency factor